LQRTAIIGLVIVSAYIIAAIFAGVVTWHDPTAEYNNLRSKGPSLSFPFGTDNKGRDIFSRFIYGSRPVLEVGFLLVAVWCVIGVPLGFIAGYWRKVDFLFSRAVFVAIVFLVLTLAIVFIGVNGSGTGNLMAIFGLAGGVGFVKLTRDRVVKVREARGKGSYKLKANIRPYRLVLRVSLVLILLGLPVAILLVTAVDFLKLRVPPPTPDWGYDLHSNLGNPWPAPLMTIFPVMAIAILMLGFYLMSGWLREILD
jgi:peptide/nickel transport system permease protein